MDLSPVDQLLEEHVPEPFRSMTWEEVEAGLVDHGASEEDAAEAVAVLIEQGMSAGASLWCIAQAAVNG